MNSYGCIALHSHALAFLTYRVLQKQKQAVCELWWSSCWERERAKEDFLALVPVYFRLTLLAVVCVGSTDAVTWTCSIIHFTTFPSDLRTIRDFTFSLWEGEHYGYSGNTQVDVDFCHSSSIASLPEHYVRKCVLQEKGYKNTVHNRNKESQKSTEFQHGAHVN